MSAKNLDSKGRFRSRTIGFRVSPEEEKLINSAVALSGLTKQDYIVKGFSAVMWWCRAIREYTKL